ncbi:MAG: helix-turn-helix domain-containing protein [Chloroflexota bacterium]|nr:MAG: helix-turn-helix domain-containing protein [Chloroflexota bacterium]
MAVTLPARGPIAPAEDERRDIETVYRKLSHATEDVQARLIGPDGQVLTLPPSLYRVIQAALEVLNRGDAISIVPIHKELTTQEAADILNVSRQYFVRLLEEGRIPFTKAGTHRRIRFGDLMEFKRHRDTLREQKLDELTRLGA